MAQHVQSVSDTIAAPVQEIPWRRTLIIMWFAQFMSIAGFAFVMPFLPFYIRELANLPEKVLPLWSGLAYSLPSITLCIFAPIWGTLADRHGRKLMVERAMFGGSVIMLLMGIVTNLWQYLGLRFIQGALTGTVVASTTLVSSVVPRKQIGFCLGMMQMAVLSGNFIGPWLGGIMAEQWGYRKPFFIAAISLFIAGLAVFFLVKENFIPQKAKGTTHEGMNSAFGGKGLFALLSVFFFIMFSSGFVVPIFPLFVEDLVGKGAEATVGMLMGITGIAAGISTIIVGKISDHIGHKRALVTTTALTGLFSIPHALVTAVPQLFGLRIGFGLAAGGTNPSMNALIASSVPASTYGRSFGIAQSASSLGMVFGPALGGFACTLLGYRWPFVIMGGLLFMSSILVAVFVKPKSATAQDATPETPAADH